MTHKVAGLSGNFNVVASRSCNLLEAAVRFRIVVSVFSEVATKYDTSIVFNRLFGAQYCRVCSEEDRALSGLIREIRLLRNLIDRFSMGWPLFIFLLLKDTLFLLLSYSVPIFAMLLIIITVVELVGKCIKFLCYNFEILKQKSFVSQLLYNMYLMGIRHLG